MDKNRLDQLSRLLAARSNRRVAAKQAGIGLAASTLGVVGLELAAAQPQECRFDFVATIRVDPDLGFTPDPGLLSGVMAFTVGEDGQLEGGTLTLENQESWELTGYAAGSSFSARVGFLPGRTLVLVGVGERPITECSGTLDGLLTGSDPGALGDWHANASAGSGTTSTGGQQQGPGGQQSASPTQQPGSGTQQPASGDQQSGQGESPPAATLAPTTTPTEVQPSEGQATVEPTAGCDSGLTDCDGECVDLASDPDHCGACSGPCQDPQTCAGGQCVCPDVACNPGAALDIVSCECVCPAGWNDCGDACCDPGSPCRGTVCCQPEGMPCTSFELCCSSTCDSLVGGGTCAPCLGRTCSDAQSCCGGLDCVSGYCGGCRDRATACTSSDQCCFSDCVNGACLSDLGGRCARDVDCRECYLNHNCNGICGAGVCGGLDLQPVEITPVVKEGA